MARPPTPTKPYTDLTSRAAVERLMSPGGGTGVIDFWAPWCAPCRAVAPHFEAVAAQHVGDAPAVRFYKVNTEAHPELAAAFNIRSIPTMVLVHDGEVQDVVVGALDARRLSAKVDWLLSRARGEGFWTRLLGRKPAATAAQE